ncbi:MAG: hypothetical protein LBG60_08020 [Bifidobacteriaceae bacterium]|jgi:ribonuclease J|nr:hypothetical protein [Bifidobacteriaceae bacterium]
MYSGLRSIGGVVATVTRGRDRVVFEIGAAYDPATDFYTGGLGPRPEGWLRDGLRLGLVPWIDGLYPAAALDGLEGIVPAEDSDLNTAVFVSHLHLDHMAYMGAVHRDIPVYLSPNGQRIEAALEETGDGVRGWRDSYTAFTPGEPIAVGQIELLPLVSFTPAYGHSSCLITTPEGSLHWTGDLVMQRPEELANRLRDIELFRRRGGLDVLICDCTEFSDEAAIAACSDGSGAIVPSLDLPVGWESFPAMAAGRRRALAEVEGLAAFNFYPREMEDVEMLVELGGLTGREVVFEPDAAWLVGRYFGTWPKYYVPDAARYADWPGVEAGRAGLAREAGQAEQAGRAWRPGRAGEAWQARLAREAERVTRQMVARDPARYLLQIGYPHLLELFDLPSAGGAYLQMGGVPMYDGDPNHARMVELAGRAGFRYVKFDDHMNMRHSPPSMVRHYVDAIDPRVLIPAHGANPERLAAKSGRWFQPEYGVVYRLAEGDLVPVQDADLVADPIADPA